MPVGRAVASVASTRWMGTAAVLPGPLPVNPGPAKPGPASLVLIRAAARVPARASRGSTASWTVPQAWHSPHRPAHLADCQPHSVQR